jgi:hypothetical protein
VTVIFCKVYSKDVWRGMEEITKWPALLLTLPRCFVVDWTSMQRIKIFGGKTTFSAITWNI